MMFLQNTGQTTDGRTEWRLAIAYRNIDAR